VWLVEDDVEDASNRCDSAPDRLGPDQEPGMTFRHGRLLEPFPTFTMFARSSRLARSATPAFARAASTAPRGLKEIVQKRPDDVVLTFAKRTAMGKRGKGQLAQYPVDEIMRALFKVTITYDISLN
jgi:hypothetical protein